MAHKTFWFFSYFIFIIFAIFLFRQKMNSNPPGAAERPSSENFTANQREAMFYQKLDKKNVRCEICFRNCIIAPGKRGFCRNRENRAGVLYNIVHSRPAAIQIDPIEKEPQLHMLPGTEILCLGTAGCNFRCKFCHNWHLSQRSLEDMHYYYFPPESVVAMALKRKIKTISFTYNDPIAFYEYMYDIAQLAKAN